MPSNQTANYALNQWSKDDRVLMEDFNADNAKIDGALEALRGDVDTLIGSELQIKAGRYVGDGTNAQFISVGFTPKAVYVCMSDGRAYHRGVNYANYYGALAVEGHAATGQGMNLVSIQEGGFVVTYATTKTSSDTYYAYTNYKGAAYHYLAVG